MTGQNQKDAGSSLPDRLFEAFYEASTETDAVIREELLEYGVDADRVIADGLAFVKVLAGQQKLASGRGEFDRIREAIQQMSTSSLLLFDQAREGLARALAGGDERLVAVFHRKLENLEPADLQSLDDDIRVLEFIRSMRETPE